MGIISYLSLVLFYDYNQKTHKMIRQLSIFPKELECVSKLNYLKEIE